MLNDIANLIEVQSLDNQIKKHLDRIEDEEKRKVMILSQQKKKSDALDSAKDKFDSRKSDLRRLETELADIEVKLEKANEHINLAKTESQAQASQHEIDTFSDKKDSLENQLLETYEEVESLEESIEEFQCFLDGVIGTIDEVEKDIEKVKEVEQAEIEKLKKRIKLILNETNAQFKDAFMRSHKKFRFNNPLTFVNGRECARCRYTLDGESYQMVAEAQRPVKCSGCQRLLAPPEAKSVNA